MTDRSFHVHKSNTKKIISSILVLILFAGFFSVVDSNSNTKAAYASGDQPILGGSTLTPAQIAKYFRSVNKSSLYSTYRGTVSIDTLAQLYVDEGYREGVRGDMAFIQGIKETGWYSYGNSAVSPSQNNFAGIGAYNCTVINGAQYCAQGFTYATARDGVRAHIQLLRSYADASRGLTDYQNPPSYYRGSAPTWSGLNGKWAVPGTGYGESIISMYNSMLNYSGVGNGCAPDAQPPSAQTAGAGYWMVAPDGGIFTFGQAQFYGSMGGQRLNKPMIGLAATKTNGGYWTFAADGGIFSFGDAQFYGSTGSIRLNRPIVGMASTPTGGGYWMVASDGGIFAFGDAQFYGSTGSIKLNSPIVGMAPTANGGGYWLVAADGGIFAFGNAQFYGSTGGQVLNSPIVGMAAKKQGTGYWLLGRDGGVFSFGSAQFFGTLSKCVVGNASMIQASPTGNGYIISATDGRIATFGDSRHFGWPYVTNVAPVGFNLMN
ncbi:MAG: glucosaminidase domain-containing protein [Acidimicrobiia bacterium]|nr:glucosaminidase domain-containing protein [Acidimicrobiia bacterium]